MNKHFSDKNIHMANKHMKISSTLLAIREMQIKSIIIYHDTPIEMVKIVVISYAGEDAEKQDLSHCW